MSQRSLLVASMMLLSLTMFSQKSIYDVARNGSVEDVKILMKINPDTINIADVTGYLPLTLACYRGNKNVATFLAERVKDINGGSNYGTALMAAVFKDEVNLVETLLKNKADPNIADAQGTTPLHYASIKRNEAIVKLLMDANADPTKKDIRGKTAMDYAKVTNSQNIIKLLNKK